MVSRDGRMALIEEMPWTTPVILVPTRRNTHIVTPLYPPGTIFPGTRTFRAVLPSCHGDIQIYQEDGIHEFELDIYTRKRIKFRK